MSDCPSEERLPNLLVETMTDQEKAALEGHLASCARCQERLQQLTDDPIVEYWRRLQAEPTGQSPPTDEEPGQTGPWMPEKGRTGGALSDVPERISHFKVTGFLGAGAFGRVYRGYDEHLEREVALKLAKAERLNEPDAVERFLREARAAARLRHPHIVPLYEAGQEGTSYYIASAFIPGQTLAAFLMAGRPDFARTVQIVRDLAEALAYAHEQGIVHRDVKPANVMLDDKGQPLLMDFGLAARLDETEKLTHEGTIMGTPLYMAPEQAAGRTAEVGPASDQYSLGVMLYEMLCSRTPFKGTAQGVLYDHVHTEPLPPRRHDSRVPRDLETICLKALAKKPAERYAGCHELADDMRHFLDDEPIQARRATLLERTVKLSRRNPTAAGLSAVTLLLVLVIGIGSALYLSVENVRIRKTQKTREEVIGLLNQADQHERARRWTDANTVLNRAQAVLRNQPDLHDEDLEQAIEGQLARITSQQAAESQVRGRHKKFLPLHDEALFYWTPFTGLDMVSNQARLLEAVRAGLALYGLAGDSDPPGGVTAVLEQDRPHLISVEHTELAAACHELLLVWAEAEASGTPGTNVTREQRQQQAHQALALLERAALLGKACGLKSGLYLLRKARYQAWSKGEGFTPTPEQLAASRPQSGLDWFQAGLERYRAGQLKASAVACEEALQRDPKHFWARYVQALCQLQDGKWADGRAALTICLHQRPDFVWARLLRGLAAGKLATRHGDADLFAVALADLDQALRQDRTPLVQYVGLVNRGVLFIEQRKWPEAIKDLREAIRLKDDGYQGYLNLAQAHQGAKEWDEALTMLNQAIDKTPRLAVLYESRARLHRERKDTAAARADFEKAIGLEPPANVSLRLAGVLLELGRLLEQGGDAAAALKRYDEALKVQSDNALAHRFQAEALLALNRRGEAAAALDRYLKLDRDPSVQAYRGRGLLHAQEGQYAAAVEMYTLALRRHPDDVATRCDRGWAYLLQDAVRPALTDFERCLHQKPDNVEALLGRGNARVRLRQVAEAVADAEAADKAGLLDERQLYNLTASTLWRSPSWSWTPVTTAID